MMKKIRVSGYPRLFFTADLHFDSERTMKLSKRPYETVEQMNEALIRNWNASILPTDHIWILGDFGKYSFAKRLNGQKHLLFGNYERADLQRQIESFHGYTLKAKDHFIGYLMNQGFCEVIDADNAVLECLKPGYAPLRLNLVHEPSKCIILESMPLFNLFGHIHKLQMVRRHGLCVSTDAHHFRPCSIKDIEFYIEAINKHYDKEVFGEE